MAQDHQDGPRVLPPQETFRKLGVSLDNLAKSGLDEKYQRDFNILNPINQYQQANPLNPAFGSGAT